jgi:hypothetical protein
VKTPKETSRATTGGPARDTALGGPVAERGIGLEASHVGAVLIYAVWLSGWHQSVAGARLRSLRF